MYERMLNKQDEPSVAGMAAYCGENGALFTQLNTWLSETFGTAWKVTFPYGNHYGWGVAHRIKQRLVCNVFAERNAFTVMLHLSNRQFDSLYGELCPETQEQIDHKYPCGDGGWLHYRVTNQEQLEEIQKLLSVKCSKQKAP